MQTNERRIIGPSERVHIHPTCVVNDATFITWSGSVTLGEFAFCGVSVMFLAGTHDYHKIGMARQSAIPGEGYDIIIGDGAWIGSGAIVVGPCRIGANAVVGAGAVVTRDVAPGVIVAGNPAAEIGRIDR